MCVRVYRNVYYISSIIRQTCTVYGVQEILITTYSLLQTHVRINSSQGNEVQ